MSVEQLVVETMRQLPAEQQQEVLDFARILASRNERKRPLPSVDGLCADLHVSVSVEDIDEMRREAWKNFPREDLL